MKSTQNLINTFAAGLSPTTETWTSGSTPDARAGNTRGNRKVDGPATPLPCPPHPHKPYSALVRSANGGLEIGWFGTSSEATAASRHREYVMVASRRKRRSW
jgi:hypothetical protein